MTQRKHWALNLTGAVTVPLTVYVPCEGSPELPRVVLVDCHGDSLVLQDERLARGLDEVRSALEYHVRNALQRAGLYRPEDVATDDHLGGDPNG